MKDKKKKEGCKICGKKVKEGKTLCSYECMKEYINSDEFNEELDKLMNSLTKSK